MGKKQKCPEFENHERWLVSYADMLTLLFAVFVVLYSLNLAGEKSEELAAGSMQESFNTPLDDIPIDRRVGPAEAGYGIFEHFKGDQIRPPLIIKYPSSSQRIKIIDQELKQLKSILEERLYGPNKHRDTKKKGEARIIDVVRTSSGMSLRMLGRHFFDPGVVRIKRSSYKEFDEVIKVLKDLGRKVTIEGHTDSLPTRGKLSNWELSALRATNVVKYMIKRHNFPKTNLGAAGYADIRPIAHNGTAAGRSLNRRIEIKVHYDQDDLESN